ncbi:ALI_collapsed_G0018060.mRNA.1.CDS.1 [Saccharomyces cerevisiae]|nr:ALI_HP1_G0029070.mRNA.1.CDS.1 [Saccharomyces cerevisiae]CAI6749904.1 ALI_collapsed_G0018060.mRNA.1.CDS.1 [Saccharomyces cerevisiae]
MTTYDIDVNEGMNKSLADLVAPWRPKPLKSYCISNTNLIDVVSGATLPGAYIFIENGMISEVEFGSEKPVTVDEDTFEIIDGAGKYVTPGLIDSHVHVASVAGEADLSKLMLIPKSITLLRIRYTLEAALARGFTTVGVVADGVPECYKAAREEFRRGADFIKFMGGGGVASPTDEISNNQFCDDEIKALVDVANSYHTYVTAHAYTPEAIEKCIKLGVKGIEHGNLLDERTAELMAESGCYLTPTLVTYKVMGSDQFSAFLGPENSRKNTEVLYKGIDAIKIAQSKKVKICFGSDLLGPLYGYQTQEFCIRGKVQTAQEILLSATVTPAEMNGLGDKLGQIKPGFIADLLMMKSNPLDDITILDKPESNILCVMKEGRIY